MERKQLSLSPGLALILSMLAACSATKPIGEWRDQNYSGRIESILIIGVTARNERRRAFETTFVDALQARGIAATPSYKLLTSSLQLTRDAVEEAIRGKQIGGVLVTRLAGITQAEVFRQPSGTDPESDYFTQYNITSRETTTAYYDEHRVLTLETSLYDTASGNLVWRMQSETIDASRPREVIEAQVELTIKTLLRRGLIGPKR
jgi:hypothetical protein